MAYVFVIIGAFVIGIILLIMMSVSSGKAMDKKAKAAGAEKMVGTLHWEGLGISRNTPCDLYLFADKIQIENRQQKFELLLERIRAAEFKSEQELKEKGKSVVGRALIGTLLVPGLGTIVGGMSGIGNKKVKGRMNNFLILNYIDTNGELAGITFYNNLNVVRLQSFCNKVNLKLQQHHKKNGTAILL